MFAASAATKAAKMALAAKDDSHLVVPEKHPAPKTYDAWRKKSDLISARRRDARSKSDVSEQASHSCFGLINTQQPQSISNDHKRGSPTHDDTKTLYSSSSADASRVRALLFESCMPCFAHDPIKLPSHSDELITNKCTAFVLVQCLGGEYAYVRCAASSRYWFFGTFCRRAGRGAPFWGRWKYRQRRTDQCRLGRYARRRANRPSTAQIELRPEYGRGRKNRFEGV